MDTRIEQSNKLLYKYGLLEKLNQYGTAYLTGSYQMNLMTWNDLDIYVDNEFISLKIIYKIVKYIIDTFHPTWFEARQDVSDDNTCYFVGFETEILGELWNTDIRFITKSDIIKNKNYCDNIIEKTNRDSNLRNAILTIKTDLRSKGEYGFSKSYISMDVYDAVINFNVHNTSDFVEWYKNIHK